VVFTSGATEANNLAILGAARAATGRHVITVATEHKAVSDTCLALAREGFEITTLAVDGAGHIDLDTLDAAFRPDTVLLSAMAANNEVGTLHPLAQIGERCRSRGVLFHTDAAQALHIRPMDVAAMGIDLLSLSAHKIYGPKGVGALYVRRGRPRFRLQPLQHGGGHERGMRSGTLPVPLIVGLGWAAQLAVEGLAVEVPRLRALRARLWTGLKAIGGVHLNGPDLSDRAANNLNLSFDNVEAEALIMAIRDIAVSTGSACTSATLEPSHVLRALGVSDTLAHSSLRMGLGRFTTEGDIDHVIARLNEEVPRLRAMSTLYAPGA
jgi:cysteine desulfurase